MVDLAKRSITWSHLFSGECVHTGQSYALPNSGLSKCRKWGRGWRCLCALAGRVAGLPSPLGNVCILVMTAFRVQSVPVGIGLPLKVCKCGWMVPEVPRVPVSLTVPLCPF